MKKHHFNNEHPYQTIQDNTIYKAIKPVRYTLQTVQNDKKIITTLIIIAVIVLSIAPAIAYYRSKNR